MDFAFPIFAFLFLPALAVGLTVAGTAVGVWSAIAAANAEKKRQKQLEQIARYNAAVARRNATIEEMRAGAEAERIRRKNLLILGSQRAAFLKSGVELAGTPEDVIYDSQLEGELDAWAVLYSGAMSSYAMKTRAQQSEMEARAHAQAAGSAMTAGYLRAGGTLLSGAKEVVDIIGKIKK